jgi:Tfp pilus assembly protein PilX
MFMALGALVIIGVLVAGSSFITLQETRLGQNSIVQTRAFAAAEYGLNKIQADWDKTPNLQMVNGTSFDTTYTLAGQGTCKVRYTRLNNETFWIVSEGRALMGNSVSASRTAVKRVGAILRLRIPTIRANGAITTAGNINVQGSPQVSGNNAMPTGWTGCSAAPGLAGIVASPTATVSIQNPSQVIGSPQVMRDPLAADDNTYVRYGDETWNTLKAMANITITNGQAPNNVVPTALNGSCNKDNPANWGEPWRLGANGFVPECINYFPIIYATTSMEFNGGRGQGILLVEGDMRINGTFEWYGLVVARDDITKGNGNAKIYGAVMARNAELSDNSDVQGNIEINYSQCSLERAMRGSAQVLQAKERAWAELY